MKILLLLLAVAAGAGFCLHDQLQTWLRLPRAIPGEVYYLKSAHQTTNPDGTVVRWAPGQELRTTAKARAAEGAVALTDGKNVLQVSRHVLTQDVNEAAALRQSELISQNTAAAQRLNDGSPDDVQAPRTYSSGTVATVNAAPVYYYPYPVYVVTGRATPSSLSRSAVNNNRASAVATPWPRRRDNPRPSPTPGR